MNAITESSIYGLKCRDRGLMCGKISSVAYNLNVRNIHIKHKISKTLGYTLRSGRC